MLRPTWSDELAMPVGFCSLAASSSRRGVSSALQAITKLRPVALWLTLSLSYQWMAVTRFCASVSILYATASASTLAPSASAACTVWTPLYIAPIGQIGWQLLLPQHAGRSFQGLIMRPCGIGTRL
ncbi:hypothetical protein D3C71_1403740 [compost metagenome]